MKKRILQFIPSFHRGGSESQSIALTGLLKAEGSFDVFAATLNGEGVLRPTADVIGLPEIPEFALTSFYNPNFVRQVRLCSKYLIENKIDLVHTHDFYTNVFGMAAAAYAGISARVASKRETGGVRTRSQESVEKLAFSAANAVVANCEAVREYLIKRGVSPKRIHIIYNGIAPEPPATKSLKAEDLGLPGEESVRFVTMVANLRHDVKNVPMLLRAAKRVSETEMNAHFVIAGEGDLTGAMRDSASQLGVADKVHFIGRCDDIRALLSLSHVCVLTSIAEGFSNSILEYMRAGKPVVATNVGGAAEVIVDGMTGYLVDSNDDEALADHLLEFLRDETKAKEFGAKGREAVVEKFSQKTQLDRTIEIYNKLLA